MTTNLTYTRGLLARLGCNSDCTVLEYLSPRTKQPYVQVLLQRWVQSCTLRHWEAAGKRNTSPLVHTRTRTAGTVSANASTQPSGSTLSTSSVPLCAHSLPAGLGRQPCAGFDFILFVGARDLFVGLNVPRVSFITVGRGFCPPSSPRRASGVLAGCRARYASALAPGGESEKKSAEFESKHEVPRVPGCARGEGCLSAPLVGKGEGCLSP